MKKLLIFLLGILVGLSSLFFYSEINQLLSKFNFSLAPLPITHWQAAGEKLQEIEFIEEDDYASTEGNHATLYQLNHQCKLVIEINGETYYAYQIIYFSKNKITNLVEIEYRSSYIQRPNYNELDPKAMFTQTLFNLESPLVQEKMSLIKKYIHQENLAKCGSK